MNLKKLLGTARRFRGGLPYLSAATSFGWHYPPVTPATAVPPDDNPLAAYFERVVDGPGIWKWRHYFDIYHRHFAKFVGKPVHVVEIGIYSGGSLPMWRTYFGEHCTVYGVDIEPACRVYENAHTKIFIGDQADRSFWAEFRRAVPVVDLVIDDGGHHPHQQQVSLEELLPHLAPGGVYLCEDIHGFNNPFVGYLAGLAALMNSHGETPLPLQQAVHGLHLYPFVAVLEKHVAPPTVFEAPKHGTEWQPFGMVKTFPTL